ncbi:MAG: glycosyltransferase family protein [Hyphomicrobiales bacterium]
MESPKILFVIQGEGHGHMTQALTAAKILRKHKFDICCALVGQNSTTIIPQHFIKEIECEVIPFDTLELKSDKKNEHAKLINSFLYNLTRYKSIKKTLSEIKDVINRYNPDLILNFYEPLIGLYNVFHKNKIPTISVGHQFLFLHPKFPVSKKFSFQYFTLNTATRLVQIGSKNTLALSFYPLENSLNPAIKVMPPLIHITDHNETVEQNNHFTVYLNRSGYLDDIKEWHKENNDIKIYCFTNLHNVDKITEIHPNFFIHPLDRNKFIESISTGKGLITTAGFESVCEAVYIGKPVLMFPMHIEQTINGLDAEYYGAGLVQDEPDIDKFISFIDTEWESKSDDFKQWKSSLEHTFVDHIRSAIIEDPISA